MKPKTIIGIVLMAVFASVLFFNFGQEVGGYMDFSEAASTGASAHVVGTWVTERSSGYDPAQNVFTFHMQDDKGEIRRVKYMNPKPANFEDAEKLVVLGHTEGEEFVAEHILVKCPSKYNAADDLNAGATASS